MSATAVVAGKPILTPFSVHTRRREGVAKVSRDAGMPAGIVRIYRLDSRT
jgi:hypothetical protein